MKSPINATAAQGGGECLLCSTHQRWNRQLFSVVGYAGKGKKTEHLYGALHGIQTTLKRSGMDHTDLPAINTIPAFTS